MKEVLNIVFSRNRALQLDLLLRSLKEHDRDGLDIVSTVILYRYDPGLHLSSLEDLKELHPEFRFVEETSFEIQVRELLNTNPHPYTMFMVDDMVVKGAIGWDHALDALDDIPSLFNIQLRLGEGVDQCYPLGRSQAIPTLVPYPPGPDGGQLCLFSWKGADGDWGYPLNVDGSVFRTEEIKTLTSMVRFSNPNTYEGNLQAVLPMVGKIYSGCFSRSRVLNIPANRVQTEYRNRSMDEQSPEDMLHIWESGSQIALEPFCEVPNNDAHFVMPYTIKPR